MAAGGGWRGFGAGEVVSAWTSFGPASVMGGRPPTACRTVLFARLLDGPSVRPEELPTEEAQAGGCGCAGRVPK